MTSGSDAQYPTLKAVRGGAAEEAARGESAAMEPKPRQSAPRGRPKWEEEAGTRIRNSLKRLSKPLVEEVKRDANEADTRLLVTEILCEALGYHRFEDLDTEYAVKGQFADYGLRIDRQLVAFVEVKRCTTKLGPKHLRQVETYALNEGVEWVILTNAVTWQLYHLEGGLPIAVDLVLEVDLLGDAAPARLVDDLLPMTREATKRGALDTLWRQVRATSPQSIARAVLAPSVLRALRSEMHRQTGHLSSIDEIARLVKETVLRPDACG
jgi:predicted type IV restriction endonuclease